MSARCYSYDNLDGPMKAATCGQAAMATIIDWHGLNPFGLRQVVRGDGGADDGRLHFDNTAFVGELARRYPPRWVRFPFLGEIHFTIGEDIVQALHDAGLRADITYPAAWSDGNKSRDALVEWLRRTGRPVITLLDMHQLWPAQTKEYALHWGIIYDCGPLGVSMASWHQTHEIPWDKFMLAWWCKGMPYPNNYYQILATR